MAKTFSLKFPMILINIHSDKHIRGVFVVCEFRNVFPFGFRLPFRTLKKNIFVWIWITMDVLV